jgi:hypothetical protein
MNPFFSFVASLYLFVRSMLNIKYLFLFLTCFLPAMGFSQLNPRGMNEDTRKTKDLQSTVKSIIKTWELKDEGAFILPVERDTSQDKIQIYHPIYKNAITNTYTGNYGGAYLANDFFSRQYHTDFLFLQTHDAYLLTPGKVRYYNTTTPYTFLDYSQSENKNRKNETRFNVSHTQNINPDLNITFRFDQARSQGQYIEQEHKNNFVSLYSTYITDLYSMHGGFVSNRIGNDENGGMKEDSQIFEDVILFNLVDTRSEYRSNYYFATSEYRVGAYVDSLNEKVAIQKQNADSLLFRPRFSFLNYLEYSTNLRQFTEEEDEVNNEFFLPATLNDSITHDSVRFHKFTGILQAKQWENPENTYSFGKRAYLGFDFVKIGIPGYSGDEYFTDTYSDIYVGAGIFRETGKFWNWKFDGRFYITGYHSGQTKFTGLIYKPLKIFRDSTASVEITAHLENKVPDYFQHRYNSNHYTWYNSFHHEQRMQAGIKVKSAMRNLEMGAHYALINNFMYNDTLGIPSQTNSELLIFSAYLNKKFVLGNFTLDTKMLFQKASSEAYIHLPDFSAYAGVYYKLLISKVLYSQIGLDARFNTRYYADAYNPATGFFHLQNEKEIGNYPYIDAYVSLKLKRTRVFFKLINVGSDVFNREYFTALHYPMNRMTFRLGVDWTFYD